MPSDTQLQMRRPNLHDLPPLPALPPGYALRIATSEDAVGIANVLASAFGPEWDESRVRRALLDAPDVDTTYVVTRAGEPVATAAARLLPERFPGSGYLHWVGTHADHRGKRLGAAAVIAVLHRFVPLGCRDAVLETEPFRRPAIRTYLNLGFQPEPRGPEQAEVWQKILAEVASR